ncbi:hypothetical protein ML401_04615 [Bradyrhizobium sp. 62B]|nr:hypothetical protein ML401_04615 [Bradyrhizobium sp. 62B]
MTAKTDTAAFRRLYGVARHYAGASDRWCEVQSGELQFHFTGPDVARSFALFCLRKGFDISLRDKRRPGEPENLDPLRNEISRPRDAALMMKSFPEKRTFPMRLELAGNYADDAVDFLHRYRVTFYSQEVDYQGIKSRRAKAYVDLRMALEALLKATLCLRSPYTLAGKPLVDSIRRYSHDIDRLQKAALRGIELNEGRATAIAKCNIAPVDLRYQFDAMNFRVPNDQTYYDTIGSSAWLKTIEEFVQRGLKRLQAALGRRSKIVTGRVAMQEFKRPTDYPSR